MPKTKDDLTASITTAKPVVADVEASGSRSATARAVGRQSDYDAASRQLSPDAGILTPEQTASVDNERMSCLILLYAQGGRPAQDEGAATASTA